TPPPVSFLTYYCWRKPKQCYLCSMCVTLSISSSNNVFIYHFPTHLKHMVVDNKGKISYIQIIKEDLAIFHITPDNGQVPDFKAGQFVTLGLHVPSEGKVIRRAYSIASPPEQKKRFELLIRWVRKPVPGRLTAELFNRKEGDEIMWVKPTGIFTINEKMPDGR